MISNNNPTPSSGARRVERTGLAVVHDDEMIVPAEGSEAVLAQTGANVVNYYFPVEIEIIGAGTAEEWAQDIYAALQQEFSALT